MSDNIINKLQKAQRLIERAINTRSNYTANHGDIRKRTLEIKKAVSYEYKARKILDNVEILGLQEMASTLIDELLDEVGRR